MPVPVTVPVGAGVALDFGGVAVSLAGRVSFGDDALMGQGSGTLAVRGNFR